MNYPGTDLASNLQGYSRGWNALQKVLLRRLITRRGSLFYDADFGMDVRAWVNAGVTQQNLWELATLVKRELEKDERVDVATVTITPQVGGVLLIKADIVTARGRFALVVEAGKLEVRFLKEGEDVNTTNSISAKN